MITKHTPGPWKVYVESNEDALSFGEGFQPFGGCGCCSSPWVNGSEGAEIANARLIAAAPDLIAALKELLEAEDESLNGTDHVAIMLRFGAAHEVAQAVIAKATGGAA